MVYVIYFEIESKWCAKEFGEVSLPHHFQL